MTGTPDFSGLLRDLQTLQSRFDASRGFEFSGKLDKDLLLQFSVLALCGEVGELANKIKKRVRTKMLKKSGRSKASDKDAVQSADSEAKELGDILAYLLKVSTLLDEDLAIRYLQQMCENTLRFPPKNAGRGNMIVLAGPSGAGKSTAVRSVSEKLANVPVYLEKPGENNYLYDSLGRGENLAVFKSQSWFIRKQLQFFKATFKDPIVLLEQDPAAIVLVYANKFFDEGRLRKEEYEQLLQQLLSLELELCERRGRRLTIVFDASADVLHRRVNSRSRVNLSLAWYKDVRERFLTLYKGKPDCIFIDTSASSPKDVSDKVIRQIHAWTKR